VSGRPFSSLPRSRRAAKRFRHRRNRLARRLLDEAYAQYLSGLPSNNDNNNHNNNNSNTNNNDSSNNDNRTVYNNITPASPSPPPPSQLNSPPPPSRSPTPPIIEPDSPHSVLTQRIFPDSPPPSIRSFSPPSYSPISSPEEPPRPASPANSTSSSVEFIEELQIPPPRPRRYYNYNPHQPIDVQILQFPLRTTPLLPGSYFIGPAGFDLSEIRTIITGQDPDSFIPSSFPLSL